MDIGIEDFRRPFRVHSIGRCSGGCHSVPSLHHRLMSSVPPGQHTSAGPFVKQSKFRTRSNVESARAEIEHDPLSVEQRGISSGLILTFRVFSRATIAGA